MKKRTHNAPSYFEEALSDIDPDVKYLIDLEEERQQRKIMMIASESICPKPVKDALASVYTNLYAEGYPHMRFIRDERNEILDYDRQLTFHRRYSDRRYYKGVDYVNFIETLAQKRCAELFSSRDIPPERIWVNVQPLSGAAANNAVYDAFLMPGDTVMGMALDSGGHLTHGSPANRSGKYYNIVSYSVSNKDGRLDYDEIKKLAIKHRPRMIIAGYSAYPWDIDWKRFREIADSVEGGCHLHADVAHTAGLISAKVVSNPVGIADTTAFTTHKTMCGPRGAVIITTDEEKARKVETAVFPSEQGGPHICNIAAKAVSFKIAQSREFVDLMAKVIENAQHLAAALEGHGLTLAYGGTNTHMVLIDLKEIRSKEGFHLTGEIVSRILDQCGITCNKNAISGDENPVHPTAIRLGTTWATQRGMGKKEMEKIAALVYKVLMNIHAFNYIGGTGEIGRGKIDFDLMEEIKDEVAKLEKSLPDRSDVITSGYPHYYSLGKKKVIDTILKPEHENLKAVFEKHKGLNLPMHYGDLDKEYKAARTQAALFDMWDVGLLEISGDTDRVMPFIQQVQTRDISNLMPGEGCWGFILDKESKLLSVVHILRRRTENPERSNYILVIDGAKTHRIKTWLRALSDGYVIFDSEDVFAKVEGPCVVRDLSEVSLEDQRTAVAVIGPKAKEVVGRLAPVVDSLKPSTHVETQIEEMDVLISYEEHGKFQGLDIFMAPSIAPKIWLLLLKEGSHSKIAPAGYSTRQRIREESALMGSQIDGDLDGLSLYGTHGSLIDLKKSYFIGQKQILSGLAMRFKEKQEFNYVPKDSPLKKSCLYEEHVKLTKKMAPFAGWEMPLWYSRTSDEHRAVRETAGLFDVSHMGILEFSGEHATRFLDYVCSNYVPWLRPGQSHYSYILDPDGKVLDDIFLYRLNQSRYMMVVNAANMDKVVTWLEAVRSRKYYLDRDNPLMEVEGEVVIKNLKDASSGPDMKVDLSLQGPNSLKILKACVDDETRALLKRLKKLEFMSADFGGFEVIISRTGYTGEEVGFELYLHPKNAPRLWAMLLEKGKDFGIKPCGLGARDSTRTEAGFPLYGNELSGENDIDPVEAGYGSFVRFHKPFFIGRTPLLKRHLGTKRAVVRFGMKERGIRAVRPGYIVFNLQGDRIGRVTSCTLVEGVQTGMALIDKNYAREGDNLKVLLVSPEKDSSEKAQHGDKDLGVAEILPRFMMELEEGDIPRKI